MEQDRTPAVFLYLIKWARGTIARLRNGRQAHRQDHHGEGIESHLQIGSPQIPDRTRGSNAQMEHLNLERNKFHGEWNYVIKPNAR
jgi:hypothetical protein